MDIIFFIKVLAWVFGVGSALLIVARLTYWYWYNCTDGGGRAKLADLIHNGGTATFPVGTAVVVFVISMAALAAM